MCKIVYITKMYKGFQNKIIPANSGIMFYTVVAKITQEILSKTMPYLTFRVNFL
jgi:hypothetical protein